MHHEHDARPRRTRTIPTLGRAQDNRQRRSSPSSKRSASPAYTIPRFAKPKPKSAPPKPARSKPALYPNPTVGYTGDEIRGGSVGGGKQGFFVQQTIVTGGKLAQPRRLRQRNPTRRNRSRRASTSRRNRGENGVHPRPRRAGNARRPPRPRQNPAGLRGNAAPPFNTGQADETEVLDAEVDAQRMRTLRPHAGKHLCAKSGAPSPPSSASPILPLATVAGDLEHDWPDLNEEQAVEAIATQSPAARIADAAARAQAALARPTRNSPTSTLRAGMEYNNELLDTVPFAKGWEGIAEVSVADSHLQSQSGQHRRRCRRDRSRRTTKSTHRAHSARSRRLRRRSIRQRQLMATSTATKCCLAQKSPTP